MHLDVIMDRIDKIFYINLDKRKDRYKEINNELRNVLDEDEFTDKVERFPAIYKQNGAVGCSLSHLEVLKLAKQKNYNNIIIFEDDFEFLVDRDTFRSSIDKLFKLVDEDNFKFRVIMLSYNALQKDSYNDLLDKTTNVQTASGYMVSSIIFDELIETIEYGAQQLEKTGEHWKYTIDQIWKKLQNENWYLFKNRIGKQRPGFSDLGLKWYDNKC
jgi:glycosyl transferase family 25